MARRRRSRRTRKLSGKHVEFSRNTGFFVVQPDEMLAAGSWQAFLDLGFEKVKARGIRVETKKKGLLSWLPSLRFDERATMAPFRNGPLLLPWNWEKSSVRRRAITVAHELVHHETDLQTRSYEAMYADPKWRWAIEMICFGHEQWVRAASNEWPGSKRRYTDAKILAKAQRFSKRVHSSYSIRNRHISRSHLEDRTVECLMWHWQQAVTRFRT